MPTTTTATEIAAVAAQFRPGIGLAEFRRLDRRFHATIASACGNPLLVEVYAKVLARLFESDEFDRLLTSTRNRAEVRRIVDASADTTRRSPEPSPPETPKPPCATAPPTSMRSSAASSTVSSREESMITRMNHAVLYVRDARAQQRFYADVLGFATIVADNEGRYAFMRAPNSNNHHDIAFFSIGASAAPSTAGRSSVGLYHIAWEVATIEDLAVMRERLARCRAPSSAPPTTGRTRASTRSIPTGSSSR